MQAPSVCSDSRIAGSGALLVAAVLLLLVQQQHEAVTSYFLGLVSALTLLAWIPVAIVAREGARMDEGDKYEVGASNGGMVIFFPAGLTALWLFAFISLLAGRALFQEQPVFAAALAEQAKLFGGASALGVLLVVALSCCSGRASE